MVCWYHFFVTINKCPVSDETHRRITFLPDKIDDDCKLNLKHIFGNPESNIFAELTGKEANDILVKASPKEVSYEVIADG